MAGDTKGAADLRRGGIGVQRRRRRNYAPAYKPPQRAADPKGASTFRRANQYKRTPQYQRTVAQAQRLRAPAGRGALPVVEQARSRRAQEVAQRQRRARQALRKASPAQRRRVYRYVAQKRRQGKSLTPEERVAYRRQQRIAKGRRRLPAQPKGTEAVPGVQQYTKAYIAAKKVSSRAEAGRTLAALPVFRQPSLTAGPVAPRYTAAIRTRGKGPAAAIVGEMAGELSRGVRRSAKVAGSVAGLVTGASSLSPYRRPSGPSRKGKRSFQAQIDQGVRGAGQSGATTPFSGTVGAKAGVETGKAFVQQPGSTTVRTAAGFRDTLAAIPGGLIAAATSDPRTTARRIGKDYSRRYGPLTSGTDEGRKQFRERIKKEGAAAELIDLGSIAVAGTGSASRLASVGVRGLAPASKAARFLTKDRPKLRFSGGPTGTKAQELSKGVIGVTRQRAVDRARVAAQARRNAKAKARGRGVNPVQAGKGEVTPLRTRRLASLQRREAAKLKGRAVMALKEEQAAKLKGVTKSLSRLSKAERKAYYYVASGTVSSVPRVALASERVKGSLRWRRKQIVAGRVESGKSPSRLQADELRTIDSLLKEGPRAFTPRLKGVVDEVRPVQRDLESIDPGLVPDQALARRFAQQAETLGLTPKGERQVVPDAVKARYDALRNRASSTDRTGAAGDPEALAREAQALRAEAAKLKGQGAERTAQAVEAQARRAERALRTATRAQRKVTKAEYLSASQPRSASRYDSGAPAINRRIWYHGSRSEGLTPQGLDATGSDIGSLFGQGIYLTDNPKIARGYARSRPKRGGTPQVYESRVRVRRVLDLEKPADPAFVNMLVTRARALAGRGDDALAARIAEAARAGTNDDVYRTFRQGVRDFSAYEEIPRSELVDDFQALASDMAGKWDALTHVGGKRTGAERSQVLIVLDPSNAGLKARAGRVRSFTPARGLADTEALARRRAEALGRAETARRVAAKAKRGAADTPRGSAERLRAERLQRRAAELEQQAADIRRNQAAGNERRIAAEKAARLLQDLPPETVQQFADRVAQEARRSGLEDPLYFPSRKRWSDRSGYSAYAAGGKRAVADPKRYTGELFRTGRQVTDPRLQLQGLALNVKRRVNWQLVADTVEKNALDIKPGTVDQVLSQLEEKGIDVSKVALWDPRKYSAERKAFNDAKDIPEADDLGSATIADAITKSRIDPGNAASYANTGNRVFAVPKAVMDEVQSQSKPSGALGRSFEIVKGKQARVMLAFVNLPWLQFQIASNAVMTGFATGGRLTDMVAAQRWWSKLPDEQKKAIAPVLGVGGFYGDIKQIKLGAAADNYVVNAWRAFKDLPMFQRGVVKGRGPSVSQMNPIDLMFRADNAQNNFFRKTVLYNAVKKEAFDSMGRNMADASSAMDKVVNRLRLYATKPTQERMRLVLEDQALLEQAAEKVNDYLGDYMTFTAAERRGLARYIMFYGFLRASLKLVFYVIPRRNPVAAAIMLKLGQLQQDEIRRLFGGDMAPWISGRMFFGDANQPSGLKSIDVSRGNPALNTLVGIRKPGQIASILPPVAIGGIPYVTPEQWFGASAFKGRGWRVEGETQPRKDGVYGPQDRVRIAAANLLRTVAPYRIAENVILKGPQGDDSLLWSPRPTQYKKKEIVKSIEQQKAKLPSNLKDQLVKGLVPFVPQPDASPEIAARMRDQANKKPKKKKGSGNPFDGVVSGGGSDNPFAGIMGG